MPVSVFDHVDMGREMGKHFRLSFEAEESPSTSLQLFPKKRMDSLDFLLSKVAQLISTIIGGAHNYFTPLLNPPYFLHPTKGVGRISAFLTNMPTIISEIESAIGTITDFLNTVVSVSANLVSGAVAKVLKAIAAVINFISKAIADKDEDPVAGVVGGVFAFFEPVIDALKLLVVQTEKLIGFIANAANDFVTWLTDRNARLDRRIAKIRAKFGHSPEFMERKEKKARDDHEKDKTAKIKANTEEKIAYLAMIAQNVKDMLRMALEVMAKPALFLLDLVTTVITFVLTFAIAVLGGLLDLVTKGIEAFLSSIVSPIVNGLLALFEKVFELPAFISGLTSQIGTSRLNISEVKKDISGLERKIANSTGKAKDKLIKALARANAKLKTYEEGLIPLLQKLSLVTTAPIKAITGAVITLIGGVVVGIGIPIPITI